MEKTSLRPTIKKAVEKATDYFSQIPAKVEGSSDHSSSSGVDSLTNDSSKISLEDKNVDPKMVAGDYLWEIMTNLTGTGKSILPNSTDHPDVQLLNTKYDIFLDQQKSQTLYRKRVDDKLAELKG